MPTPLLLILSAAGFGASPLLIVLNVGAFPPWTLGALRAALGLPLLIIAAGMMGAQRRPDAHDALTALVGGILTVSIPFVSMAAGMQYIPSGMGGMLYATMPLFTLALAALFLRDEPATLEQALRIAVGIGGVLLIAGPGLVADGLGQAGLGTALTLISPLSYAAGNVWFRRRRKMAPLMLSAGMFLVGALSVWPLALLIDGTPQVVPSGDAIGILIALVVLATVAPNLLNYALVQQAGANKAALAMFLMPGFSVVFGMIFLDERLPLLAFAGLALVIGASSARIPSRWIPARFRPGAGRPRVPES
ncbi:MAG TPA: DMT family transporter [Pararhodobacter sp.]|uniref:DMT family transporter n=1 Tax=Pararhodobacter sp. TaxID=2127056 RepID=UPI001DFCA8CA|nr:DMT family transporter [Pararhodobacter sp.]MCB1344103.1 DMT family transporter [Paracoccaceae bacterium]HPD93147.1 DMT family transporter [Pararhodobacter sp.]